MILFTRRTDDVDELNLLLRLLPDRVAIKQASFERRKRVMRALQAGAAASEIATRLGVSESQVYAIGGQATKRRMGGQRSPVERYFRERRDLGRLMAMRWMI
jgi:transposase-like protein